GLQLNLPHGVVSAKVNNKVEGLTFQVYHNKDVEFLTLLSSSGMRTYVRSLCFVLCKAVEELYPGKRITLEHPISKGYFCSIKLDREIEEEDINRIKRRMNEIIAQNIPFHRHEKHTTEVVELFRQKGMLDKVRLLESSEELYSYYYTLEETLDYYYGALLPSTGYIKLFDLLKYSSGALLRIPNRNNPDLLEEITNQEKMLEVFQEHQKWNEILGITTVGELNMVCNKGYASNLINLSEALQEKKIIQIADDINNRSKENGKEGVKVVLISGPSSSGKTTFSKRLSVQLMVNGRKPVPISLDNYFVNRVNTPKDETGEYDYESLYALDLPFFNKQLKALIAGEEVELPTYNFVKGEREFKGEKLKIDEQTILVLEGIHALNPEFIPHIEQEKTYKIYVSALTTISLDDHNHIPTTDNRLLRRILRDYKYRNYSAEETISRWQSVRAGEDKWIFPYQENADAMFNSALLFELAVLKDHLEPILRKVPNSVSAYSEAFRLRKFLNYFASVQDVELPPTSLLREFVGGSSFKY
ncbi:MAG: nucleoside kinase, partial [Phocaeicola sp.]